MTGRSHSTVDFLTFYKTHLCTLLGVLIDVQDFYKIGDSRAGGLQASFVIGFMVFSPVFGYCGDRYNRKWLMVFGILFWSLVSFAGSFIPPHVSTLI